MLHGTIFETGEQLFEVVVQPETPERIIQARNEVIESGLNVVERPYGNLVGNFAIRMTDEQTVQDIKAVIIGEVIWRGDTQ